jgi:phenylacetate-CoA ligase
MVGPLHDYFARNVTLGDDIEEILPEIRKFKPDFIKSTPSYLRLLAQAVSSGAVEEIRPKALMTGGEVLDEPTRSYLQDVFGCKTYQGYSASEIGKIGLECERRIGLHVSDSVIVEILKDGKPTVPGESGNIVVTCLLNAAMPMIRYDLGDVGSWANSLCSCGRNTPLIESVDGRREDHLTFSPNRIVSPKSLMSVLHRDMSLPPSQLVQETDDVCRLRVFTKLKSRGISNLLDDVQEFLGSQTRVELSLEPTEELKVKFRPVISYKNLRDKRWTLVK